MIVRPWVGLGTWLAMLGILAGSLQADIITFSNSSVITIPRRGVANPYPSAITASGVNGQVFNFTLTLNNLSHTYSDDISAAVVAPSGEAVLLFSGPGPNGDDPPNLRRGVSNQTWTFDDRAASQIPINTPVTSGTYRPGLFEYDDSFPADSTGRTIGMNYGFNFEPFKNVNPNGVWALYVMDSALGDAGSIAGGWSISFDLSPATVPEPSVTVLSVLSITAIGLRKLRARRTESQSSTSV